VARTALGDVLVEVRDAASRFEADRWSGSDCARLAEELSRAAKACEAASARAAARAVACQAGDLEWVARVSGVAPARVRESLATTAALAECPATFGAVADGSVSLTQAREIVRAESAVAGSEVALLEVARTRGISGLREESRKIVLGSIDREELHRRQHAARSVRHWIDDEGMVAGGFRLPPELGVPFVSQLDAETDRVHRVARREGSNEAREAHAADALLAMVRRGGKGKSRRADVVFVCSLDAYRRGGTEGDELCHVIGGGPVPVSVVRDAVADDPFVKAVLMNGCEINTVAHFGRRMKAELRTALELGPAPQFEGAVCVEAGCDRRYGLQWDHLGARCAPDHRAKTERDRKAGLLGGRSKERGPP
jgi:hypothetical protein